MSSTTPEFVYQIKDWDANFENNKSRGVKVCSFVCVPNKQHGLGFARVVSQPDGAALYGIWQMIIGAASRQEVRGGWLTVDGHHEGTAWTLEDLALQFRRPVEEIARALDVLSSPGVGWIVKHARENPKSEPSHIQPVPAPLPAKCLPSALVVPPQCPVGILEEKGMEGNGREVKGRERTEDLPAPPPESTGGGRPKRPRSKPSEETEPDPRHHKIITLWHEEFKIYYGAPYVSGGGRDGTALKRFLKSAPNLTPSEFMDRANLAWTRYKMDRFATKCGQAATLHGLCTFWNDIGAQLATSTAAAPRKPNTRDEKGQKPGEFPTDATVDNIERL